MAAPDAWRRWRIRFGRATAPSRMPPAAMAMTMSGQVTLPADREKVWAGLNDAEMLKRSIPGCQEMVRTGDDGFTATAKVAMV